MKRKGFTIAEALITLGIVGVVAAMSIPTFISNYRKQIYAKTLSTAVSNFETAMSVMMMKEGATNLFETRAWSQSPMVLGVNSEENVINRFTANIGETLGLKYQRANWQIYYQGALPIKNLDDTVINPETFDYRYFASAIPYESKNGITYFIFIENTRRDTTRLSELIALQNGTNLTDVAAQIVIDINGPATPNTMGRDIFRFVLNADGHLYPLYSRDFCRYDNSQYEDVSEKCVDDFEGEYCGAYLMQNGYKMDY